MEKNRFDLFGRCMVYPICAISLLLVILGNEAFAYLSLKFQWDGWKTLSILFSGIYTFIDSMWLFFSAALIILLYWRIKNGSDQERKKSVGWIVAQLIMLMGLYNTSVIQKHIEDVKGFKQWLGSQIQSFDPFILLIVLGIVGLMWAFKYVYIWIDNKQRMRQMPLGEGNAFAPPSERIEEEYHPAQNAALNPENPAVDQSKPSMTNHVEPQKEPMNTKIDAKMFLLILPIVIMAFLIILKSGILETFGISGDWYDALVNSTLMADVFRIIGPIAFVSVMILVALFVTKISSAVLQFADDLKNNLGHPQAFLAVLLEIFLLGLSPVLSKVDAFNVLLSSVADGGLVNTILLLIILFLVIWVFLVMLSVPKKGYDKDGTIEAKIRDECTKLSDSVQLIAVEVIKSGIHVINYVEAIFTLFGVSKDNPEDEKGQ